MAREIVASRDEALAKMRDAGTRILLNHTAAEVEAWAKKTVDAYIERGLIEVRSHE